MLLASGSHLLSSQLLVLRCQRTQPLEVIFAHVISTAPQVWLLLYELLLTSSKVFILTWMEGLLETLKSHDIGPGEHYAK